MQSCAEIKELKRNKRNKRNNSVIVGNRKKKKIPEIDDRHLIFCYMQYCIIWYRILQFIKINCNTRSHII